MQIHYLALILLANISAIIIAGIVHSSKSWAHFRKTHESEIQSSLSEVRAKQVPLMIAGLLDYVDQERQSNPGIPVTDLLSHGHPDWQLRVLEPKLRVREQIGEARATLDQLSTSATRSAKISIFSLVVALASLFPLLVPPALSADTFPSYGYVSAGVILALASAIGLTSVSIMHIREASFGRNVNRLRSEDIANG